MQRTPSSPTEGGPRQNGRRFLSGTRGSKDVSPCGIRLKIIFNRAKNPRVRGRASRAQSVRYTQCFHWVGPSFGPEKITKLEGNVVCLEVVIRHGWSWYRTKRGRDVSGIGRGVTPRSKDGETQCKRKGTSLASAWRPPSLEDLISVASLLFSEEGIERRMLVKRAGTTPP